MIDLIIFYATEADYLKLFAISIIPLLMAPLAILFVTRYIFLWFDPNLQMTTAKMFMFVSLAVIISLIIMLVMLYLFLPPGTDFRLPLLFTLLVFGLLGTGRLYLTDSQAPARTVNGIQLTFPSSTAKRVTCGTSEDTYQTR